MLGWLLSLMDWRSSLFACVSVDKIGSPVRSVIHSITLQRERFPHLHTFLSTDIYIKARARANAHTHTQRGERVRTK